MFGFDSRFLRQRRSESHGYAFQCDLQRLFGNRESGNAVRCYSTIPGNTSDGRHSKEGEIKGDDTEEDSSKEGGTKEEGAAEKEKGDDIEEKEPAITRSSPPQALEVSGCEIIPSTSRNWQTRSLNYEERVFLSI